MKVTGNLPHASSLLYISSRAHDDIIIMMASCFLDKLHNHVHGYIIKDNRPLFVILQAGQWPGSLRTLPVSWGFFLLVDKNDRTPGCCVCCSVSVCVCVCVCAAL